MTPHMPIRIEGARVHNLRNVSLDIPWNRFTVITGPSGSGKSSLAFDTIYAEGQRQYIESLSVYSRQFLHQLERPDVDSIKGLQPTIAIDQRGTSQNPRSTVATVTEIYDYLRLLYSRVGIAHCYHCGRPIRPQTPEQIRDIVAQLGSGIRLILLAPIVRGRKGQHKDVIARMIKSGFVRARIDGTITDLSPGINLDPQKFHQIEIVTDRIVLKEGILPRLLESIKQTLKLSEGQVCCLYEKERIHTPEGTTRSVWKESLFSSLYCCPRCKINYNELEPRTFSFNSPYGVCPVCEGTGRRIGFDPALLVPDMTRACGDADAIAVFKGLPAPMIAALWDKINLFIQDWNVDPAAPMSSWDKRTRNVFFAGNVDSACVFPGTASAEDDDELPIPTFPGFIACLDDIYKTTKSKKIKEFLELYRGDVACQACEGSRIRPEARTATVNKLRIHDVTALPVVESLKWFSELVLPPEQEALARPIIQQILTRLDFMNRLGLDYLTLDRPSDSLSGGERQRVRLATGLGCGLTGVCYVLDEPSSGLHPRDNNRLIDAMRNLQQQGNTVLVVEHDEAIMRSADWLVDIGPGAGKQGGMILAEGTPEQVATEGVSLTGKYLSGRESIPVPARRRKIVKSKMLVIDGVTTNNLKNVAASFPLGTFVCVTGVSGSGKSSLLNETLVPALSRRLGITTGPNPGPFKGLRGANRIDKLIQIDQSPIGRSPRSNPATYTGLFDEIRKVFASSRDARRHGYKTGRFSFNVAGGRCEACQGQGLRKIEMHFLPDMYAVCPVCEGKRFNRQTLEVKYKDKSIAEVLDMSIDEAVDFFANHQSVLRPLESLQKVGLGYLTLGQSSTTLSGGEAQRIKLATELARVETGNTLYVLDEPTCGLHTNDIRRLLEVLSHLVDLGNTVIVIEHNLDVMKTADWIIDLGPEGGRGGGEIIACGTPEEIAALDDNDTGQYLRKVLPDTLSHGT
ncbi:MAG: excinuclease ABC subunit UvrA [Thermoguttaceae bacterium]|nr:excinuclease ABC subunit UvrA [Thermoguttaceae bacterium]